MAQMKVHGISDKVMGLSSPRTMFFISLEPVKVFCQICPTRFFKDQKDPVFQGLIINLYYLFKYRFINYLCIQILHCLLANVGGNRVDVIPSQEDLPQCWRSPLGHQSVDLRQLVSSQT